jgi:hypothetical protein
MHGIDLDPQTTSDYWASSTSQRRHEPDSHAPTSRSNVTQSKQIPRLVSKSIEFDL